MKKTFLTLTLSAAVYSQTMAQASGLNPGGIVGALIGFAILVALFLAFRQIVLWYWKVDTIIKNQEQQIRTQQATNSLLNELIGKIGKENTHTP